MEFKTLAAVVLLTTTVACGGKGQGGDGLPLEPSATVQELMLAVIDPNVDPIWNSISTTISAAGEIEIVPQTDEEWLTLRHHAITLREAANLLSLPGRQVAVAGASTSIHPVELDPDEIGRLIQANWAGFTKNARGLHAAADRALQAIEAKDVAALEEADALIEHACETCHGEFWYPGDKRPGH